MIRILPTLFLAALLFVTGAAFAADLDSAKKAGQIGERADGYLGLVVASAPSDVRELVATVNAKRKREYQRIAKENDLSIEQVQALAGKKAIQRTRSGLWVLRNGGWTRK